MKDGERTVLEQIFQLKKRELERNYYISWYWRLYDDVDKSTSGLFNRCFIVAKLIRTETKTGKTTSPHLSDKNVF